MGLGWQLPRLVGPAAALDLLVSSRKVDGEESERLGLVNQAVGDGTIVAAARDYVIELAERGPPASIAVMKPQVYHQLQRGLGRCRHAKPSD